MMSMFLAWMAVNMVGTSCLSFATAEALLIKIHHSLSVIGPAEMLVCRPSGIRFATISRQALDISMRFKSWDSVLDSAIASKTVGMGRCTSRKFYAPYYYGCVDG